MIECFKYKDVPDKNKLKLWTSTFYGKKEAVKEINEFICTQIYNFKKRDFYINIDKFVILDNQLHYITLFGELYDIPYRFTFAMTINNEELRVTNDYPIFYLEIAYIEKE